MKNPAEKIALWADRLWDISAMGLRFTKYPHDSEAFRAVQSIAMEMLALATGDRLEALEPLRAPIFSHPTPPAVGDAAVMTTRGVSFLSSAQIKANGLCSAVRWRSARHRWKAWCAKR